MKVLAAVALFLFCGGLVGGASAGGAETESTAACAATPVHYDPAASGAPRGVGGPWIATTNSAFRGYLFYVGATRWARTKPHGAQIFTTKAQERVQPKVLWLALGNARTSISIRGMRLDRPGSFTSKWPGVGGRQYPSYVEVPTAGCWRVSVSSGSQHGSVTFVASDRA